MGNVIRLTRLNNQPLAINSDLIKWVESAPDSVITLISGEKVVVKETVEQIIDAIVTFRRALLAGLSLPATDGATLSVPAEAGEDDGESSHGGGRG
jgi:flagellar protein FlbD